jgi:hypothetical protein
MCCQSDIKENSCRVVHCDEEEKWCPECWDDLFEEAENDNHNQKS